MSLEDYIQEIEFLKEEIENLKSSIIIKNKEIEALKSKADKESKRYNKIIDSLENKLVLRKKKYKNIIKENNAKISDLENQIYSNKLNMDKLRKIKSMYNNEEIMVSNIKTEYKNNNNNQLISKIFSQQNTRKNSTNNFYKLPTLNDINSENSNEYINEENSMLKKKVNNFEKQLKNKEKYILELKDKYDKLENKYDILNNKLKSKKSILVSYNKVNEELHYKLEKSKFENNNYLNLFFYKICDLIELDKDGFNNFGQENLNKIYYSLQSKYNNLVVIKDKYNRDIDNLNNINSNRIEIMKEDINRLKINIHSLNLKITKKNIIINNIMMKYEDMLVRFNNKYEKIIQEHNDLLVKHKKIILENYSCKEELIEITKRFTDVNENLIDIKIKYDRLKHKALKK